MSNRGSEGAPYGNVQPMCTDGGGSEGNDDGDGCNCGELRRVALAAAVTRCLDVFRLPPKVDTGRRPKDL